MMDLFTSMLLKQSWENAAENEELFSQAFANFALPDSVIAAWYGSLFPDGSSERIRFGTAYQGETRGFPQVIVQFTDQPQEHQFLGFVREEDEETEVLSILTKQTVLIHIIVESAELARALFQFVKNAMMRHISWFYSVGAHSVDYDGGGDVAALRDAFPDDVGIFVTSQRWTFGVENTVRNEVESKPIRIYPAGPWSDEDPTQGEIEV